MTNARGHEMTPSPANTAFVNVLHAAAAVRTVEPEPAEVHAVASPAPA